MKIVIGGASGAIGSELAPALRAAGHEVRRLVRHTAVGPDEISWDPPNGILDSATLDGADAIINLSGENVGAGRWTKARRERILRSRIDATRTLVLAIGKLSRKPSLFISASAVGCYGSRGDEELTEKSEFGPGFLPEVCLAWETHAEGAARHGVRTVFLRFGIVLMRKGGALAKMLPLFRLGLGGPLGSGKQWMSWVSIEDVIGVVLLALSNNRCVGPVNVVTPEPANNEEFTRALSRVVRRPAFLRVPAWALRLVFGQMADEALLASTGAVPRKLERLGYSFRQPELEGALRSVVG